MMPNTSDRQNAPLALAESGSIPARTKKKKHRRSRVRSAWISFVGRILAQFVGSAASILLALILVGNHQPAAVPNAAATATAAPGGSKQAPVVVVLSLDSLSGNASGDVSAAINAALRRDTPSAAGVPDVSRPATAGRQVHVRRIHLQPDSDLASAVAWSTNSSALPGVK
jgi:hypothetical protein